MKNFRYILSTILLAVMIASLAVPGLSAKSYVSLKGGFHIQIPDNWSQLDYNTVDAFLYRNQADRATIDYEAAFTVDDLVPFYASSYLILDVDTAGDFSNKQIDSVLNVLAVTFDEKVKFAPVSDMMLTFHPVSLDASRAFWPLRPIASDSFSSSTATVILLS